MGGEQSREKTIEDTGDETEEHEDTPASAAAAEDTTGELPQCMMGNRQVDNMCFMISCTNWY
ncbi:hypothetical protein JOB18_037069 [Solea senegalensis]|uniref:Uncharacterized protein n=1 Tax=Solea senegalensis TaxID=28829 RepID=A0AAV6QPX6_SOLSE|nr:hypothetical protein JOB18_037069 [Solea senegalensis]